MTTNMMHVNPVASDGAFTIGYDADGVAGQWPGNMTETTSAFDFARARGGATFNDGNEGWDAHEDGGSVVWRDGAGNWEPAQDTLRRYGDR